ncbi:RNA polymerase factor sigma-32 [Roseinatronobacter bogoriensis]|uniref:RNA polymerase sigma factor n=1 Tax=Roseinatronobacter bogoriensis subsp. barguzinensis TaxID=441209 RepID=A0A2K8K9P4_9RHOB|nr:MULTISPECIES: RNA polymerase factor sigma-32 [Rhodobaca]ATX66171.1 RNA polymerase factor sigma-32 [Rhodobaca barguzinensis]MBB4207211.1 RNA polymerase sigma-32 factor [Rhodobaca bogoriensis DSM 18756]TDW40420.1 RNA polymerase sigma-32 factor [Rhodobaca barguzinensis]TDY70428.1 RNA polymerase sigma-32 factor [Rhodobaca bogoriensis DSM 18756]
MQPRDPSTSRFIRDAMASEMLDAQTEHALAIAWRDARDEAALHRLITAYARLAISVATRFRRYGMPLDDLIQQGNLGLMRAAEKYDPENGARFSTYAAWWIRASMQEYVMRNWSVVRTATNASQKKLFFHLRKTLVKLDDGEIRSENLSQSVARELDVPEEQVEIMLGRMSGQDLSLNTPQSDGEEGRDWLDTIVDANAQTEAHVLGDLEAQRRRKLLYRAVQDLPEREQRIISERHLSDSPRTLAEIGVELGISKERVRQLEERAMSRITTAVREAASIPVPA